MKNRKGTKNKRPTTKHSRKKSPSKPRKLSSPLRRSLDNLRIGWNKYLNNENITLESLLALAHLATAVKKAVPHGKYQSTIEKELPFVEIRQVQIAVQLSQLFDFENHPILYCGLKSHYKKIKSLAKREGVEMNQKDLMNYLRDKGIDISLDPEDENERNEFFCTLKTLANPKHTQKETGKNNRKAAPSKNKSEEETKTVAEGQELQQEISLKSIRAHILVKREEYQKGDKSLTRGACKMLQTIIDDFTSFLADFSEDHSRNRR